jgi:beta-glucanase (GH16 family)
MERLMNTLIVSSCFIFSCSSENSSNPNDNDAGADSDTDADTQPDADTDAPGILSIIGLKEDDHGASYTSGRLNSNYEVPNDAGTWVRARLKTTMKQCDAEDSYVNGSWPAFWLLGSDSTERWYSGSVAWPECGEVDIVEWIGSYDDTHFQTNQWGSPAFPVDHNSPSRVDLTTGPEIWHTYGVRFNGDSITYTFDGSETATKNYNDPDDHTHRIILNMALGGDMAGTIADDFDRNILQVDWVRVTDTSGNYSGPMKWRTKPPRRRTGSLISVLRTTTKNSTIRIGSQTTSSGMEMHLWESATDPERG